VDTVRAGLKAAAATHITPKCAPETIHALAVIPLGNWVSQAQQTGAKVVCGPRPRPIPPVTYLDF